MICEVFWWECVHEFQTLIAGVLAVVGGAFAVIAVLVRNSSERRVRREQDLKRRSALAASLEGEQLIIGGLCSTLSFVFGGLADLHGAVPPGFKANDPRLNDLSKRAGSYMEQIKLPVLDVSLDRIGELGPEVAQALLLVSGKLGLRLAPGVPRDEELARDYAREMAIAAVESHIMTRVLRQLQQEFAAGKANPSVQGVADWEQIIQIVDHSPLVIKPADLLSVFHGFIHFPPAAKASPPPTHATIMHQGKAGRPAGASGLPP